MSIKHINVDGIPSDEFDRILNSFKKPQVSKSGNSSFFEEAAKPIFAFFGMLDPDQKLMILQGSLDLFECYQIHLFEVSLQSKLKEKPITTRKLKI